MLTAEAAAAAARTATPAPQTTVPPVPARRPGEELVERRLARVKVVAGSAPGRVEARVYAAPVHFRGARGEWVEIDPTLVPVPGGRLASRANAFGLSLAADAGDRQLARVELGGGAAVGFGLAGARPARGARDSDELTYPGVLPGVDLRLTSGHTAVKEDLILRSRAAGDTFVFPLTLVGLSASLDPSGDVMFSDAAGVARARIPTGWMEDANVDPRSGDGARSDGVAYTLEPATGGGTALRVTLDRAWLDDAARVFPVRVDPTVNPITTFPDDTYVQSPFTNDYSTDSELKVGTYNGGGSVARSFLHFDLTPWHGTQIDWARLLLWNSKDHAAPRPSAETTRVSRARLYDVQ